jgi:hypothetical protein
MSQLYYIKIILHQHLKNIMEKSFLTRGNSKWLKINIRVRLNTTKNSTLPNGPKSCKYTSPLFEFKYDETKLDEIKLDMSDYPQDEYYILLTTKIGKKKESGILRKSYSRVEVLAGTLLLRVGDCERDIRATNKRKNHF